MSTLKVNTIEPTTGTTIAITGDQTVSGTLAVTGNFSCANIVSGTYTPTTSGATNCTVTDVRQHQYLRVGNILQISGTLTVSITTTGQDTSIAISLPVSSAAFADVYQATGVCCLSRTSDNINDAGLVAAIAATTTIQIKVDGTNIGTGTVNNRWDYTFMVKIS